ncbi:hypothetical protein [Granulicoccus phenolivorans]|uniref:hypothetical protein n=1 Tax=Granulicoccus phenolivorans TaxID=266854 RepID=UPI00041CF832|nr:hypothetical protein [Granulicoccus phenolivorans]
MAALVALLAPPGPMDGICDALTDWSAAGMIEPFLWIDAARWTAPTPPVGVTPGLFVNTGRRLGTSLEHVVTQQQFERVRLVVLVPAVAGAPGVDQETEHAVHQAILRTAAVPTVELIRAVVTRPASGPVAADLTREGWHNVILAPEESRGPGLGHSALPASTDPLDIGAEAAAQLAGLTGLWRGLRAAPLDGAAAPFGHSLRLARSWYRNLDSREVEDTVRTQMLSTADGVPLPRLHGSQAVYIDDAQRACSDMASAVLGRHASLFRGERVAPAPVDADKVGPGKALSMLFGFIKASMTMAPMKWYSLVLGDVQGATANRVQSLVFGQDPSSYEVVASGSLAGGRADWREVGRAAGNLDHLLDDAGPRAHEGTGDFTPVWVDFVESGLTLVDAGERSYAKPIPVGTERGVLRTMSDCVPSPQQQFTRIPPRVASAIGISTVRASDPLGIRTLQLRLRGLGDQPSLARDADTTLRELEQWQNRYAHTYSAGFGGMLGQGLMNTAEEVQQLLARLSGGDRVDLSDARTQARQRTIASWMRGLLIGLLALVVVLCVLTGLSILTWWGALLAGLAGVLAWFGGSLVLFLQGQRDLFRDLTKRKAAMSQVQADEQNLRTAMRDLRRFTEGYGQFQEWSRVLSVVIHQPFGEVARVRTDTPEVEQGLPLNVRVGKAETRPESAAEVVNLLRRDLFTTGWLSGPWQATLNDAGNRLGPRAYDLTQNPRLMFAQRSGVQESWLGAWADLLEREGIGPASGNQLWAAAMQRLSQPEYQHRLVAGVRLTGAAEPVSQEEFLGGVGDPVTPPAASRFGDGVLSREAQLDGRAGAVEVSWPLSVSQGLSRRALLVQLSEAAPEYTFNLGERLRPERPRQANDLVPEMPFSYTDDAGASVPMPQRRTVTPPADGMVF